MRALKELSQSGSSMLDWRRRMLLAHSLRPTRRSVIPDIYRHLKVRAWTQQVQPWTADNDAVVSRNWNVIDEFVDGLEFCEDPGSDQRTLQQRNPVADGVSLKCILERLLVPMWFSLIDGPKFSAAELAIQWHLGKNRDATAAIYRIAAHRPPLPGGGRRAREFRNDRLVNLFQGEDPEKKGRRGPRGSIYPGDRNVHARGQLTVQIHDLDLTDGSKPPRLIRGHVPAIAVWMPESMRVDVFDEMPT